MFKPELWQSHNEYRTIVNTYGRKLSRNNPKYALDSYDKERQKLLNMNLDPVIAYISGFYSSGGRCRTAANGSNPRIPDRDQVLYGIGT